MKSTKWILGLLALLALQASAQVSELADFLRNHTLKEVSATDFSRKKLNKEECAEAVKVLEAAWRKETQERYRQEGEAACFQHGDLKMAFLSRIFGKEPADGRSLYISMHGGGATAHAVNDGQWQNQIRLYTPAEGLYVAPRAPWDDWNMWFKPGMDEFFEDLIKWAVVTHNVNPDKVYLMGYSAGGDGVWRMAPRMADRWAAASMMAGHPGNAQQVNLLHVPYMIWMGELDAAYQRNEQAVAKGRVMDELQQAMPEGYVHETHIVAGKGHWMDRADTLAVSWMPRFTRNPLPKHVIWQQEEVTRPYLYWLSVNALRARQGMRVDARVEGNTIRILRSDYRKLRIYLNDELVDLDKKVRVVYGDEVLFSGRLRRTLGMMANTLEERGDVNWIFPACVDVEIESVKQELF